MTAIHIPLSSHREAATAKARADQSKGHRPYTLAGSPPRKTRCRHDNAADRAFPAVGHYECTVVWARREVNLSEQRNFLRDAEVVSIYPSQDQTGERRQHHLRGNVEDAHRQAATEPMNR
jgi:hypothetical protein